MKAMEGAGFAVDRGPLELLQIDHKKCRDTAEILVNTSKQWQAGDETARGEVVWAVSEYTSMCRQHFDRLKNLIIPLLEQTFSVDEEHKISEDMDDLNFESAFKSDPGKYIKLIETLEDRLSDWK